VPKITDRITFIRKIFSPSAKTAVRPGSSKSDIIAVLDSSSLHTYMLKKIGNELQFLVEPCYYPRVADIFKELIHRTKANEKELVKYSKEKYFNPKWKLKNPKLLQDPQTILLILIAQDFAKREDYSGAIAAFNLLSLRFYTNTMYKHIKYCNSNYFKSALENLSHNHLFNTRKTIGGAVMYLSAEVFKRYKNDLREDNAEEIVNMIYYIRTRVAQSVRSFANHYYKIAETGGATRQQIEDLPEKENVDKKIKLEASKLAKNITVYASMDMGALNTAQRITRFNRKMATVYAESLVDTKYKEQLELLLYLYMRNLPSIGSSESDYITTSKKLMAVKVSKKPVFYKKSLVEIHDQIIVDLGLTQKFDRLSAQSKHISRSFLSYYLALMVHSHFN
jgi:hypothetical protein